MKTDILLVVNVNILSVHNQLSVFNFNSPLISAVCGVIFEHVHLKQKLQSELEPE